MYYCLGLPGTHPRGWRCSQLNALFRPAPYTHCCTFQEHHMKTMYDTLTNYVDFGRNFSSIRYDI